MFTGLIEEVGAIGSLRAEATGMKIGIRCPTLTPALDIGESIAVNGVCLTVTARSRDDFEVQAVGDTLEKTTLRGMRPGARVNLERALRASGRLDGHFVTGHVTGRARIKSWGPAAAATSSSPREALEAWFLVIDLDPAWAGRVAAEGSIAIDGISLTVAGIENSEARISVIPSTRLATCLSDRKAGDEVNVELDVLASYVYAAVAALLGADAAAGIVLRGSPRIDIEQLKSWGYR